MSDDEDYDAISNENDGDNVTEAVSSRNAAKPSKSSKKASASAGSVGGKRKKPDVIEDESDAAADDDLVDDADAPVGGAGAAAPAKPKVVSESSISSSRAAAGKPNPYAGAAQAAMAANKKITTEREGACVVLRCATSHCSLTRRLSAPDTRVLFSSIIHLLQRKLCLSTISTPRIVRTRP